jgi:hypothetical protein
MENRGAVNQYTLRPKINPRSGGIEVKEVRDFSRSVFTVNLACGVTPFCHFVNGQEYNSLCYRIEAKSVNVTQAWYRPKRDEFEKMTPDLQEHILNGGLTVAILREAILRQLPGDPVEPSWNKTDFDRFALMAYGRDSQGNTLAIVGQ